MCGAAAAFAEPAAFQLNNLGLERMDRGDYEGGVAAFAAARSNEPDDATLRRNHALALNAWAIRLGDAGQYDQAVRRLREALELEPGEAAIGLNLAVCRINLANRQTQEGRFRDAELLLSLAVGALKHGRLPVGLKSMGHGSSVGLVQRDLCGRRLHAAQVQPTRHPP